MTEDNHREACILTAMHQANINFCNLWIQVTLYFDGYLYRGNRATKMHAGSFHAFDSPNLPPLVKWKVRIEGKVSDVFVHTDIVVFAVYKI